MQVSEPERALPSGTVALLFTDIEGSSMRWEMHREQMRAALDRHDLHLRSAIEAHGGTVFKTIGDAFCAVFTTASDAIAAACEAQRTMNAEDWSGVEGLRVRMAVHTGPADLRDGDYFGPTVNRVARLLSVGHGGQVLISGVAKELAEGCMPPQATLRDLGAHRLKDLTHPEQVYQLIAPDLDREFPPLRSLEAFPNNLPLQLTTFIGRDDDITEIKEALERARLVTLVGAGGVGKTRLSLQVGADVLERFEDGVWFAELAPLSDPELIATTLASIFGVRQQGEQPLLETVAGVLRPKRVLLIMDNCEHLVDEAARVSSHLLHACPNLRILASSREGLGIEGESVLRVPSLSVPSEEETLDVQGAMQYGAVALFVDRAKAADRRFTVTDANAATIAEICRQLDGIALAIELAAPRVKVLSVEQLASRLNERFRILTGGSRTALPRQQTMRALIDWSYDLLSENERTIFRRIAVFAGSFSIDAAGELCADENVEAWDVLDVLSSLVDKSLVVSELVGSEQRYRLLVSTRQYALERLEKDGELLTMQRRHAEYYAGVAERAHRLYYTTPTRRWLESLEPELDNMRAAMEWALSGNDAALGVSITASLLWYWSLGQRAAEATTRIRQALDASASLPDSPELVRLYLSHAFTSANVLLYGRAAEASARALQIAERIGDSEGIAFALMSQAAAAFTDPDFDFESVLAQSTEIWRTLNNRRMIGYCLFLSARSSLVSHNDVAAALPRYEEALKLARAAGDERNLAVILNNLAEMAFYQGNIDLAIRQVNEAMVYSRAMRVHSLQATNHNNLAAYLIVRGDYAEAAAVLHEGLRLARDTQTAVAIRVNGTHFSVLAAAKGDCERAARLLGNALACYEEGGSKIEPTERKLRDKALELLEPQLGKARLEQLMGEGAAWDTDRVVEEMLAV
jgi:predicted ATPase/class 3 adenylate cyclase